MGSLTEKAYTSIKDQIVHYRLKPRESLRYSDLAEALNMSQTPVREALVRLDREGLVCRQGGRGYVVRGLDLAEIKELYDFRIVVEVEAARLAAGAGEPECLNRLSQITKQVISLLEDGRKEEILPLEQEFHTVILSASGNRFFENRRPQPARTHLDDSKFQFFDFSSPDRCAQAAPKNF